jgi:3-oxoacyl-[acyl-carrier protein] reductase
MDLQLKNKVVFIAASSKGLGLATAEQLLQEEAIVIINGRNSERIKNSQDALFAKYGDCVLSFSGNVTDPDFAHQIKIFIEEKFGKLDVLITNSGGPARAEFKSISDEEWQSAYELTFLSHVRLIRTFLPLLRKSSTSNVLTITSVSVKQPIQNLILSNSIRAATVGLTKTLALELADE